MSEPNLNNLTDSTASDSTLRPENPVNNPQGGSGMTSVQNNPSASTLPIVNNGSTTINNESQIINNETTILNQNQNNGINPSVVTTASNSNVNNTSLTTMLNSIPVGMGLLNENGLQNTGFQNTGALSTGFLNTQQQNMTSGVQTRSRGNVNIPYGAEEWLLKLANNEVFGIPPPNIKMVNDLQFEYGPKPGVCDICSETLTPRGDPNIEHRQAICCRNCKLWSSFDCLGYGSQLIGQMCLRQEPFLCSQSCTDLYDLEISQSSTNTQMGHNLLNESQISIRQNLFGKMKGGRLRDYTFLNLTGHDQEKIRNAVWDNNDRWEMYELLDKRMNELDKLSQQKTQLVSMTEMLRLSTDSNNIAMLQGMVRSLTDSIGSIEAYLICIQNIVTNKLCDCLKKTKDRIQNRIDNNERIGPFIDTSVFGLIPTNFQQQQNGQQQQIPINTPQTQYMVAQNQTVNPNFTHSPQQINQNLFATPPHQQINRNLNPINDLLNQNMRQNNSSMIEHVQNDSALNARQNNDQLQNIANQQNILKSRLQNIVEQQNILPQIPTILPQNNTVIPTTDNTVNYGLNPQQTQNNGHLPQPILPQAQNNGHLPSPILPFIHSVPPDSASQMAMIAKSISDSVVASAQQTQALTEVLKSRPKPMQTNRPDKFSGAKGKMRLRFWQPLFEKWCDSLCTGRESAPEEKLAQLFGMVTDEAINALNGIKMRLKPEQFIYDNVMKEFLWQFDPIYDKSSAKQELSNRYWQYEQNESIASFLADIEHLVAIGWPNYAAGSEEYLDMVKEHFCNGLPKSFQFEIRKNIKDDIKTLVNLIHDLWRIHRETNSSSGVRNKQPSIFDYPVSDVSLYRNTNKNRDDKSIQPNNYNSNNFNTNSRFLAVKRFDNRLPNINQNSVTCFKCNETGHYSRDCKKSNVPQTKTVTCFTCNEKGHYSNDCPKKKNPLKCVNCDSTEHNLNDCPNPRKPSMPPSIGTKFDTKSDNKNIDNKRRPPGTTQYKTFLANKASGNSASGTQNRINAIDITDACQEDLEGLNLDDYDIIEVADQTDRTDDMSSGSENDQGHNYDQSIGVIQMDNNTIENSVKNNINIDQLESKELCDLLEKLDGTSNQNTISYISDQNQQNNNDLSAFDKMLLKQQEFLNKVTKTSNKPSIGMLRSGGNDKNQYNNQLSQDDSGNNQISEKQVDIQINKQEKLPDSIGKLSTDELCKLLCQLGTKTNEKSPEKLQKSLENYNTVDKIFSPINMTIPQNKHDNAICINETFQTTHQIVIENRLNHKALHDTGANAQLITLDALVKVWTEFGQDFIQKALICDLPAFGNGLGSGDVEFIGQIKLKIKVQNIQITVPFWIKPEFNPYPDNGWSIIIGTPALKKANIHFGLIDGTNMLETVMVKTDNSRGIHFRTGICVEKLKSLINFTWQGEHPTPQNPFLRNSNELNFSDSLRLTYFIKNTDISQCREEICELLKQRGIDVNQWIKSMNKDLIHFEIPKIKSKQNCTKCLEQYLQNINDLKQMKNDPVYNGTVVKHNSDYGIYVPKAPNSDLIVNSIQFNKPPTNLNQLNSKNVDKQDIDKYSEILQNIQSGEQTMWKLDSKNGKIIKCENGDKLITQSDEQNTLKPIKLAPLQIDQSNYSVDKNRIEIYKFNNSMVTLQKDYLTSTNKEELQEKIDNLCSCRREFENDSLYPFIAELRDMIHKIEFETTDQKEKSCWGQICQMEIQTELFKTINSLDDLNHFHTNLMIMFKKNHKPSYPVDKTILDICEKHMDEFFDHCHDNIEKTEPIIDFSSKKQWNKIVDFIYHKNQAIREKEVRDFIQNKEKIFTSNSTVNLKSNNQLIDSQSSSICKLHNQDTTEKDKRTPFEEWMDNYNLIKCKTLSTHDVVKLKSRNEAELLENLEIVCKDRRLFENENLIPNIIKIRNELNDSNFKNNTELNQFCFKKLCQIMILIDKFNGINQHQKGHELTDLTEIFASSLTLNDETKIIKSNRIEERTNRKLEILFKQINILFVRDSDEHKYFSTENWINICKTFYNDNQKQCESQFRNFVKTNFEQLFTRDKPESDSKPTFKRFAIGTQHSNCFNNTGSIVPANKSKDDLGCGLLKFDIWNVEKQCATRREFDRWVNKMVKSRRQYERDILDSTFCDLRKRNYHETAENCARINKSSIYGLAELMAQGIVLGDKKFQLRQDQFPAQKIELDKVISNNNLTEKVEMDCELIWNRQIDDYTEMTFPAFERKNWPDFCSQMLNLQIKERETRFRDYMELRLYEFLVDPSFEKPKTLLTKSSECDFESTENKTDKLDIKSKKKDNKTKKKIKIEDNKRSNRDDWLSSIQSKTIHSIDLHGSMRDAANKKKQFEDLEKGGQLEMKNDGKTLVLNLGGEMSSGVQQVILDSVRQFQSGTDCFSRGRGGGRNQKQYSNRWSSNYSSRDPRNPKNLVPRGGKTTVYGERDEKHESATGPPLIKRERALDTHSDVMKTSHRKPHHEKTESQDRNIPKSNEYRRDSDRHVSRESKSDRHSYKRRESGTSSRDDWKRENEDLKTALMRSEKERIRLEKQQKRIDDANKAIPFTNENRKRFDAAMQAQGIRQSTSTPKDMDEREDLDKTSSEDSSSSSDSSEINTEHKNNDQTERTHKIKKKHGK